MGFQTKMLLDQGLHALIGILFSTKCAKWHVARYTNVLSDMAHNQQIVEQPERTVVALHTNHTCMDACTHVWMGVCVHASVYERINAWTD